MSAFRTVLRSSAAHGLFAATVFGCWTFWANRMHPMPAPLIAALVQAALSATIAVGQKKLMELVYGRTASLILPVLAAITYSMVVIVTVHTLARTPEILATILPPWTIGIFYATAYTLALRRLARAPS